VLVARPSPSVIPEQRGARGQRRRVPANFIQHDPACNNIDPDNERNAINNSNMVKNNNPVKNNNNPTNINPANNTIRNANANNANNAKFDRQVNTTRIVNTARIVTGARRMGSHHASCSAANTRGSLTAVKDADDDDDETAA